ncbi:MAG: imidazole glycerol phosphate synthase subunit HisH [Acidobacteria bacterium]|nr:imidazole glycerol phosphate synthase subunit HisH [Acidobacteriota bacterium]
MPAKITLVDYGAGNLPSVERALRRLGAETERAADPRAVEAARVLVLPGVGHFGAMMRTLGERGLISPLRFAMKGGVPFLGICLGLHALFESSAEASGVEGLGILPGCVEALPQTAKLPHMGWNQLRRRPDGGLLRGVPHAAWFYFAHSFAVLVDDGHSATPSLPGSTVAVCEHGAPFVAVLQQGATHAVQFHPEKSGEAGAQVLRNFLEMSR